MAIEVIADISGLKNFAQQGKDAIARSLEYVAQELWGNLRKTPPTPTDEGRLAGSFELERMSELSWRIYTNVLYARMVHEGTGIYGPQGTPIVPVQAKALSFFWKRQGVQVIAKSTAGQEPQPYADEAIAMTETRAQEFARRAINEIFGGAA